MTALLTDNLPLLAGAPNGIKKLRELILELAVRGKLVPQNPNDEPASELLKRIAEEKARLVAEGKIKKQKPLAEIGEEEKPFELPEQWQWVRLGEIAEIIRGVTYNKSDASDAPLAEYAPLLRGNNINRTLNFDRPVFVPQNLISKHQYIKAGDIVIAMSSGSADLVGKAAQATVNFDGAFGAFCGVVRSRTSELFQFFGFFFQTPLYRSRAAGHGKGIGINNLQKSALETLEIPIPPLAEQHRIVAKVDELMALCDRLEARQADAECAHAQLVQALLDSLTQAHDAEDFAQSWQRLAEHFHTLFTTESSIDALKQTLLQLAVMGKLVPQEHSDEPASEMLKRIQAEKQRLIAEGMVKKQKFLARITEDEEPFELPVGWSWARLDAITQVITKGSSPKWQGVSYTDNPDDVLFVTSENVGSYRLRLDSMKYVEKKFNKIEPRSILEKGDFLMNIVGASIGRTAIFDIEANANINQAVCLIRVFNRFLDSQFLLHFFNSDVCLSYMFDKQVDNARANLSMGNIAGFVIPMPPLAEQHRIVAKAEQLMALCDQLKARLNQACQVHKQLANALVEQAVA